MFLQSLVQVYTEIIIPFALMLLTVVGAIGLFLYLPWEIIDRIKNGKVVTILIILDYAVLMPVFLAIILMIAKLIGVYNGNNPF